MKRTWILAVAALFFGITAVQTVSAFATAKTVGEGASLAFDDSGMPPDIKEKYALMAVKCNNAACHTLERVVRAVIEGTAPISGTPFDKSAAKAYGVKMMRRPDSNIDKKEAKAIVEALYYLLDQ